MLYGKLTPIQDVIKTPLVLPEASGAWYKGIAHKDLHELVTTTVAKAGLNIADQKYAVNPTGVFFSGAMRLEGDDPTPKDQPKPWLGWTTGNDRRTRLRFYLGGTVAFGNASANGTTGFVFKELCKTKLEKTHTIHADLQTLVSMAVQEFTEAKRHLGPYIAMAGEVRPSYDQYNALLVEAGRGDPKNRAMQWSKLGLFDIAFKVSGKTMMDFMKCHSKIVRQSSPIVQINMMLRLRQIIRETGLLKPSRMV